MYKIPEEKVSNLSELGNVVPEGYNYQKKKFIPGTLLNVNGAVFKWYNLALQGKELSDEEINDARNFIETETKRGRLHYANELGFVILHRAGEYLLLLLSTWRDTNEVWESIYLKKSYEPGDYLPLKFKNDHKGTFCVWELGAVWHERNAWVNFIKSKRDEEAKLIYLNDLFEGEI